MNNYKFILAKHLQELGIERGDNLVLFSKLSSFGIVDKKFPKKFLDFLIKHLTDKGTLIMPSYSFENDNFVFDVKKISPNKTTGKLVKFFFKKKKIIRSLRPIHSHIGIGKKSHLLKSKYHNSFGKFSDFYFFTKNNFKCIFLGCDPSEAATYFIHLEYLNNVPYKKKTIIKKKLKINKKIKLVKFRYNIKITNNKIDLNLGFKKMIKEELIFKKSILPFGKSYALSFKDFEKYGNKIFKKNKLCLVKKFST